MAWVSNQEESKTYLCTWFDELASINKPFRLNFYTRDGTVEIIDVAKGRVHLKRIKNEALTEQSLFVGNTVMLYGRKYKITEFGDNSTKQSVNMANVKERAFILVKPDAYLHLGKIISEVCSYGYQVNRVAMARFNEELVGQFYSEHTDKPYFPQIVQAMTADVVIGVEILGDNAIQAVTRLAGPTNPQVAKQ